MPTMISTDLEFYHYSPTGTIPQMRQLLKSAMKDAMHESVNPDNPAKYTRPWFEWVRSRKAGPAPMANAS